MNDRWDPFTLAGIVALGAALLLVSYVATEPERGSDEVHVRGAERAQGEVRSADRGRDDSSNNGGTSDQPDEAGSIDRQVRDAVKGRGWRPSSGDESIPRSQVGPDLPAEGPKCSERPDLVTIGKQVGAAVADQVRATARMPVEEENSLGAKLEAEMPNAEPFRGKVDLPADVARYGPYVQTLVAGLATLSTRKAEVRYRIHVIHDDAFNAFALPGGVLGITTGVFEGEQRVQDEAELIAVLGHEIAHVEFRHPVAIYEATRAVLGPGVDEAAIITAMLNRPISSEFEHASDRRGVELAALAGYDPGAASRVWRRMADAEKTSSGPGGVLGKVFGGVERVLATHPPAATRCARTRTRAVPAADAADKERFYRGKSNLRKRKAGPVAPR